MSLGLSVAGQGCAFEQYGSGEKNSGRPTETDAGAGGGLSGAAGVGGSAAGGAQSGAGGAGGAPVAGASGSAGQGGDAGAAGMSGGGTGGVSGSAGASGGGASGLGGASGGGGVSGGAGVGGSSGGAGDAGASGAGGDAGAAGAGGAGAGGAGAGGAGAGGAGAGGGGAAGAGGSGCVLFMDPCDLDCDGHQRVDPVACPGGDDCCDSDADVFPGQTKWFTTSSACGSFDYDCDKTETQRIGQGSKCVGCNFFDCCHTPGYEGAPPPCGVSGPVTGCKAFCAEDDASRVQECH